MSETVISVENLSKAYRLGVINHGMLYKDIQSWWARKRGKEDPHSKLDMYNREQLDGEDRFWALKDINLEIKQGDRVGIIGKNGAGKSTLLKVLSRVTAPTSGSVKVKGRIASLLEVGTGFHPELTGRENIYLNGAILGMTKTEISRKFDEIVDFAGIGKFVDTPVKRYSSGMYVRLAFAVAAHLEPEILVVDEVLAVGDAEFQKKAIGKMQDVSSGGGRTVLFVSHNMAAVQNLCTKGILLENGGLILYDSTSVVINQYLNANVGINQESVIDLSKAKRSNGKLKVIKKIWIENNNGEITKSILMGEEFTIKFQFDSEKPIKNALFGFGIENNRGERITSLNNEISGDIIPSEVKSGTAQLLFKTPNIMDGVYYVSVSIVENQVEWIDYIEQAISFEVDSKDVYNSGKLIESSQGKVFMNGKITVFF